MLPPLLEIEQPIAAVLPSTVLPLPDSSCDERKCENPRDTQSDKATHPIRRTNPRAQEVQRRYRKFVLFASIVITVGVILRVWHLDRIPGINGDEAWYGVQAQQFVRKIFSRQRTPYRRRGFISHADWKHLEPIFHGAANRIGNIRRTIVLEASSAGGSVWNPHAVGELAIMPCALGRQAAWTSTLILCVLPTMIAYSRIAWDACQTVLFCLPVLYWPIEARRTGRRPLSDHLVRNFARLCYDRSPNEFIYRTGLALLSLAVDREKHPTRNDSKTASNSFTRAPYCRTQHDDRDCVTGRMAESTAHELRRVFRGNFAPSLDFHNRQ